MDAPILWSVVEEHLDEAGFLVERWQAARSSPLFTRKSLRTRIEQRLDAHLEGLAQGGVAAAEKLLWPALENEELATAAALALLRIDASGARPRLEASGQLSAALELLGESIAPPLTSLEESALFGGLEALPALLRQLAGGPIAEALWAIAFTGRLEAADVCVQLCSVADPRLARRAFESFAHLTGAPLDDPRLQRAPEPADDELPSLAEDLAGELVDSPVDLLPLPDPTALIHWWRELRSRLDPAQRYLLGRPYGAASVQHALEHALLWRRDALAHEIARRSGGSIQLPRLDLRGEAPVELTGLEFQTLPEVSTSPRQRVAFSRVSPKSE
jgi:hypothetical protein